jgi:predicted transcriptional regulator
LAFVNPQLLQCYQVTPLEHLSAMSYVEREEKREQFQQNALAAWNHYQTTGLRATAKEADAWLSKLEAGKDAAPPKCHV